MARSGLRVGRFAALLFASLLLWCTAGSAIPLDKDGDMKLGVRTYVNARVGTEDTHNGPDPAVDPNNATPATKLGLGTFPRSEAGHLRQNRAFIEAELNHDVSRLVKEGIGPFNLINDLPFKVKHLAYHVTFRGEGEGLYDWGPREYSTASDFNKISAANEPIPFVRNETNTGPGQQFIDVAHERHVLRKLGTDRERLFQAYVEGDVGDLFWRVGRQILSWGETDSFQLLDHINPLDASFGGFLVPLDERRIPLDMALGNYYIGDIGGLVSEMYLEGFLAVDNKVGYAPGTPAGSAWALPNLGAPTNAAKSFTHAPARTLSKPRGGFQLKFNAFDATFSLAHYYTYFDTPAIQVQIHQNLPRSSSRGILTAFDDGEPCPISVNGVLVPDPTNPHCGVPAHAFLNAPQVQVSGASTTFAVPQLYSVVRSEVAYFKDEAAYTQGQLDPFLFQGVDNSPFIPSVNSKTTGGRRLRDSFNAVVGIDANAWVRFLNPNQTFLFSTQFFYKYILDHAKGGPLFVVNKFGQTVPNPDREVLPVQTGAWSPILLGSPLRGLGPIFITQPSNQYLQTFFVGTSYRSGTVSPGMTIFYDWGGAFLYQPSLTLSRDPFRFIINYTVVDAHTYKGGSGVSLLKDRDNVEFRLEYVI